MSNAKDYLFLLRTEIEKKQKEIKDIEFLLKDYPDLKIIKSKNETYYASSFVNNKATNYDWIFVCACCNDAPLEVSPYIDTPIGKVYSDPTFIIGNRSDYPNYYSMIPFPDWKDDLRKNNIQEELIEKINSLFPERENNE